jgi:hypothetical protein
MAISAKAFGARNFCEAPVISDAREQTSPFKRALTIFAKPERCGFTDRVNVLFAAL